VAVVASVHDLQDGRVRVVFDDALSAGDGTWAATGMFTSRDYDAGDFMDLRLDAPELEAIGLSLAARLAALARSRRP
jgi:hypothetical protein